VALKPAHFSVSYRGRPTIQARNAGGVESAACAPSSVLVSSYITGFQTATSLCRRPIHMSSVFSGWSAMPVSSHHCWITYCSASRVHECTTTCISSAYLIPRYADDIEQGLIAGQPHGPTELAARLNLQTSLRAKCRLALQIAAALQQRLCCRAADCSQNMRKNMRVIESRDQT
jgi:hypothetical protein